VQTIGSINTVKFELRTIGTKSHNPIEVNALAEMEQHNNLLYGFEQYSATSAPAPRCCLEGWSESVNQDIVVVLVVEDQPLIRAMAVEMVEQAGFLAIEASSADEAIAILESRDDIRLVFTDVQMPGSMDGLRLAHAIRERWPPVQLVLASGAEILEERQIPQGARFFRKPYDEELIGSTLKLLLGEQSAAPAAG
jgi:CheY-like chemotaxis protein